MPELGSGSLLRGLSHQPLLIVGPWPLAYDPPHTLAFSSGHLSSWLNFAFSHSGIEESSFLCAESPLLSVTQHPNNKFSVSCWHLPGVGMDCHSAGTGNLDLCSIGR